MTHDYDFELLDSPMSQIFFAADRRTPGKQLVAPSTRDGIIGANQGSAAPSVAGPRTDEPQPKVLVVEDNDVNRMLITDYLEAHGLGVVIAVDGDDAVARALDASPDVIVMDVQLPRRDGLSATRELKGRHETRAIPVIALTALAMKGDEERCLAAGCDEYLSKPCDPDEVLRAVMRFLS